MSLMMLLAVKFLLSWGGFLLFLFLVFGGGFVFLFLTFYPFMARFCVVLCIFHKFPSLGHRLKTFTTTRSQTLLLRNWSPSHPHRPLDARTGGHHPIMDCTQLRCPHVMQLPQHCCSHGIVDCVYNKVGILDLIDSTVLGEPCSASQTCIVHGPTDSNWCIVLLLMEESFQGQQGQGRWDTFQVFNQGLNNLKRADHLCVKSTSQIQLYLLSTQSDQPLTLTCRCMEYVSLERNR